MKFKSGQEVWSSVYNEVFIRSRELPVTIFLVESEENAFVFWLHGHMDNSLCVSHVKLEQRRRLACN